MRPRRLDGADDNGPDRLRQDVLASNLDHARDTRSTLRKERAEIKVVGENRVRVGCGEFEEFDIALGTAPNADQ